jgi:hypothetical protein
MINADQLRGFVREVTVATNRTPALMHDALVRTAIAQRDRVIAEQTARSGFAPHYRQIVDGVLGAPLEAVKPTGVIVFAWDYILEVVIEAMAALAAAVPVRTGNLLEHIRLFADGVEAARDGGGEAGFGDIALNTKQVVIVVDVEYARRLEVGLTKSGAPVVHLARPHFVEQTAIILQSRFRDQARVTFTYSHLGGAAGIIQANFGHRRRRGEKGPMTYPSIVIEPRTA